jgi:putative NADH-flavin reductase
MNMKILLLGATGRTGKHVVNEALCKGYELNCLVRNRQQVSSHALLTIMEGTPEKPSDLENAIQGSDAIISVLNVSRKSDFPWAPLRSPKTLLCDVMKSLIPLATKHNVKRIVICSAWGASETKKDIPAWFRWFIDHSNLRFTYKDHERQEELLIRSNLSWTIVRPVGLTNAKKNQEIMESFDNEPKPKLTISRASVAQYLVDALERENLIQKKVVISGK